MITLNAEEQKKIDIVRKVNDGKISVEIAQKLLNVSERTVYRYLKKYRDQNLETRLSLGRHGNTGKTPHNRACPSREKKILEICKEHYSEFNRSHAREELESEHQIVIAPASFNRLCNRHNILTKKVPRKRKKKARLRRDRSRTEGLMIQLDGSPHLWFGVKKTCLIIAIDDASGRILYGQFSPTETTFACMEVVKNVVLNEGIFAILYVDKAGIFGRAQQSSFSLKREGFSNMKRSLEEIGVDTMYAHSPEAKGRVERAFLTLQDRLVAELSRARISTITEANKFFNEQYLPRHNQRFSLPNIKSEFNPLPLNKNLDEIFYMSQTRKVKNDHTFSLGGRILDVDPEGNNLSGLTIEIRSYPDGRVRYFVAGEEVWLRECKKIAC